MPGFGCSSSLAPDVDSVTIGDIPNNTATSETYTASNGAQVAYRFVGSQFTDAEQTIPEDVTGRIGEFYQKDRARNV